MAKHNIYRSNKGSVLIESALTLGLFLTIVLGAIQLGSLMYLRQHMLYVAHESVYRAASDSHTDYAMVQKYAVEELRQVGIADADVIINPPDFSSVKRDTTITVELRASAAELALISFPIPFAGQLVTVSASMAKQY